MKKSILSFILILSVAIVFAQDVIYTISGEISQSKTALDSILVENISTGKRALFAKLPALQTYQINLTKNAFWGTVGIDDKKVKSFSESRNLPGLIAVSFWGNAPVETDISVFAANGQMVFATKGKTILPGNTVEIKLVNEGVFFVRFDTPAETKTFKAVGVNQVAVFDITVTPSNMNRVQEKSGILSDASLTNFLPGDTIRVSIYKNGYYARPKGMKITTSSAVNFPFEVSTVAATGTSDGYVPLNEITTNVTAFDTLTGLVKINYTGENPGLLPGDVIAVDVDTMGYLRKVVSTTLIGGTVTAQTVPAYMNEIFVDKEIKLNTGLMNPGVQLKSNASMEEISEALTDENGYIHPVEVYYHTVDGRIITKSAFSIPQNGEEVVPVYDFTEDIATDLYGKSGDNVHFYIDKGKVFVSTNAVFDFDFRDEGRSDTETKLKQGDLNSFKFYLEGTAGVQAKLKLDISKSFENKDPKPKNLLSIGEATAKFYVTTVPVWITFKADIYGKFQVFADATVNAEWGFECMNTLQVGATYTKATNSFEPFKRVTPVNDIDPLNIEGQVNASARLEIYPRAEMKFYGVFGPFAEIVPYIEGKYNARVQSLITAGGTENFLAWNSGIDLGLDLRVGSLLTFLGWNKEFGPEVINYAVWPLWQSPANIELLTTLPAETTAGKVIQLKFKVTDNEGMGVNLCPIYLEGAGSFSKQVVFTGNNTSGEATIDWTVGSTAGDNSFTATLYKADKSVIKELTKTVIVKGGTGISGPIDMVLVDGGTFQMGSTSGESDEQPVHSVTLSSYYIGKTEVTQAQWVAVVGSYSSYFKGDDLPVEYASWNDVQIFITMLNQQTGQNYRLPTEAEWEFAARGGNSSKGYTYSGSNSIGDVAWYGDNSGSKTHAVGTKAFNELGLYDMSGNVWEWCYDWYGSYPSGALNNPLGPASGSSRVRRGGSWYDDAYHCRVADRYDGIPGGRGHTLGFRLAHSSN